MAEILSSLLGLSYWIGLIILCIKGKFKVVVPVIILTLTMYTLTLGLMYQYSLPQELSAAPLNPFLLYTITAILLICFVLSFVLPASSSTQNQSEKPPFKRWIFLSMGILIHFISIFISLTYWYVPSALGQLNAMPLNGIIANIIGVLLSATFLFLASKHNSFKHPNLMRKIVILLVFLSFQFASLILSLILLYSFPVTPPAIFPTEAAINMVSYIIWALLLIGIKRECAEPLPTFNLSDEQSQE